MLGDANVKRCTTDSGTLENTEVWEQKQPWFGRALRRVFTYSCGGRIAKRGREVVSFAPFSAEAVSGSGAQSGSVADSNCVSLASVSAVAAIAGGLAIIAPRSALAACTPSDTGTAGNDVIICDLANAPGGLVDGLAGDDTITLDGVVAPGLTVRGDTGTDTIRLINGAQVTNIEGEDGVDTIDLINGTVTTVNYGAGDESATLDLTNVTVTHIVMGTGNDTVIHDAGTVGGSIFLGSSLGGTSIGADSFTLSGGSVGGRVVGDNGVDTINLNSGSIGGEVRGLGGNDIITLDDSAPGDTVTIATIDGGDGVDTINLDSGTVTNVTWGHGDETYTLDLTDVTVTNIAMGTGADNFTHSAGHIGFSLFMGAGVNVGADADTFTLDGGTIGGRIEGDLGIDTINLKNGSVALEVRAGGGNDVITLDDSAPGDTVTIGGIQGGAGVDTINLISGTVGGADWGAGDETATLDLTDVTVTHIVMGTGADNFTHRAGHIGGSVFLGTNVNAGTDADTFTLDGGTIGSRIEGDSGADTINLLDGSALQVRSRNGNDIITLDDSALGDAVTIGSIDAGNGVDTIALTSGTVGTVNWEAGDESGTLDLTNVNLTGGLVFGTGSDNFTLNAGTVGLSVFLGTSVFGGTDADTFTLNGGIINQRIEGDAGADTLILNGGEVLGGTSVRTRDGDDVITLDGTILHSSIDAGGGSDTINLISGGVTTVNAGAGDDSGVLNLTNVTVGNTTTSGIGSLVMGTGSDNFTLNAGVINGSVHLGNTFNSGTDADTFTLNAGTITGQIEGDAGADTLNLNGGDVSSGNGVRSRGGNDTINLAGSTLAGNIDAGSGNDIFNWTAGTMGSLFTGGVGADTATIGAVTYSGTQFLDGSDADTATDMLIFDGASANVGTTTIRGWESVSSVNSTLDFDTLRLNGLTGTANNVATALNVTGGDVTLSGASVLADLLGSASNETLTVTGTTVASNNVEGAGGADTISITGNASVTGGVFGGAAGHDSSAATDGGDTITINTTGSVDSIDGGLGDDAINLRAGTVNTNVLGGDGDDTVNVFDSATIGGVIDGGANGVAGDTILVDTATTRTFDASNLANFEVLQKDNTGVLTLTGAQGFTGGTVINGGTLDIDGTTETPTVAMADTATLNVDGTVQAAGPAQAAITGSAGVNTVNVAGTLLATADLGGGADVLDVAGTLDAGTGTFALGLGDDTFTIHDGTTVIGTVDGGAGTDVFNTNIATTASVGATLGFETLLKTGAGLLNLTGPAASAFDTINVNAGTVDADGAINGVSAASVLAGATFNVDGPLSFTAGADTLTVAGTISGASTIDLGAGNDTFTFQEGAVTSVPVDGGAGTDTLNANILTSGALARAANFETLTKTGAGVLNITGPGVSDFSTVNVNDGTLDIAAAGSFANVNAATVAAGATLDADGAFGFTTGTDNFDISGVVTGAGTFDMLGGDDTLTLRDGADLSGLTNAIDGNAGADTIVVNVAGLNTVILDGSQIDNFERLQKDGGLAFQSQVRLTGAETFTGGIDINAGTVDVHGTIGAPTVSFNSGAGTFLVVSNGGVLDDGASGYAGITGTPGVQTVGVRAGGVLRATADLGDGADVLDVAGTLDTGGGTFALGAGDDFFTIHDGTSIIGIVDGGAGTDIFNPNITTTASLGAAQGFETLTKTGAGVLNVTGPGVSDFSTVNVNGGTLDIAAAGSITNVNAATVASGATLDADGAFDFTAGGDTFDISGVVSGAATFDMLAAADTLTLRDGADLSGFTGAIDGNAGADTVVVDNASALTFSGTQVTNFETLQKDNTGVLTLAGTQSYAVATTINGGALDVDDTLETPTVTMADATILNVDGTVQAAGPTQAAITGSAGANTVNVNAGAMLLATGDLGDGTDTLDVAGTLDAGAGTFFLGAGNDTFTINDGTMVIGTVDGGAGTDVFNPNINTIATLGATFGFETLTKTGVGILNLTGPGASSFDFVNVNAGTVDVAAAGSITNVNAATVAAGATLNLAGGFLFTPGADSFDVAGSLSGAGNIDMLADDDIMVVHAGSNISGFSGMVDGGDGTDQLRIHSHSGVLPDMFTNFEEIYLLDATDADVHMPGLGARTLDVMLAYVQDGSSLVADGNSPGVTNIMGDLVNLGVVTMADGGADDVINVSGDYAGDGILRIDAALDATAVADKLVIGGQVGDVTTTLLGTVSSGTTMLEVTDVGTGEGVATGTGPGAGIVVVDVSASGGTAPGDFVLNEQLVAGKYGYNLNLESDGIWYLQSTLLEQVAGYVAALPGMLGIMSNAVGGRGDSLYQRAGQADYFEHPDTDDATGDCDQSEPWTRARGGHFRDTPEIGSPMRMQYGQLEFGVDRSLHTDADGCLTLGGRGIVGRANSAARDREDKTARSRLNTRYHGAGGSMTWRQEGGFYVDASAQAVQFNTSVSVDGEGTKADIDAWGVSASLEAGLRKELSDQLFFTPRVQFVWSGLYADDFVDADGAEVALEDNQQFTVTQGFAIEHTSDAHWAGEDANVAVYGLFDIQYAADRETSIISSGEEFHHVGNKVWGRVGAGATFAVNKNVSVYGEVSGSGALTGRLQDSHAVEGNFGVRLQW